MKIIDISKGLLTTPVYPGDPEPEVSRIADINKGAEFNLSVLKASLHTGTHIDAPNHFFESGKTIDQLPLEMFIGKAQVKSIAALQDIHEAKDIKILLIKGNQELDLELAKDIIRAGFITVGTELDTIGNFELHRLLLERNIGIIENLDLKSVKEGKYFLFAPPIKVEGREAAFTRAVLLEYSGL